MEQVSLIVSILALAGSLYTYIVHDGKIKKQERLINDYQLKKNQEEEQDSKRAKVRANIIKEDKGRRIIKVYNAGKATARNVNFNIVGEVDDVISNPFPYEFLHSHDHAEVLCIAHKGSPDKIKVLITWDDDYKANNEHSQILTF